MSFRRAEVDKSVLQVKGNLVGLADGVRNPFSLNSEASRHRWYGIEYTDEWDFVGIPTDKIKGIKTNLSQEGYAWMPTPVGFSFAANLQRILTFAIHKNVDIENQISVARTGRVLMGMGGFGGDTIAMASFFHNVSAGDFCPEQLKRLTNNVNNIKPNVKVDKQIQNVMLREDLNNFDALVLEPSWRQDWKPGTTMYETLSISRQKKGTIRDFYTMNVGSEELSACVIELFEKNENLKVIGILVPYYFSEDDFRHNILKANLNYLRFLPKTMHCIKYIPHEACTRNDPWIYSNWKTWEQYPSYGGPDTFLFVTRFGALNKSFRDEFYNQSATQALGATFTPEFVFTAAPSKRVTNWRTRRYGRQRNNGPRGSQHRHFSGSFKKQEHQRRYQEKEARFISLKNERAHQAIGSARYDQLTTQMNNVLESMIQMGNPRDLWGKDFVPIEELDFDQQDWDDYNSRAYEGYQ